MNDEVLSLNLEHYVPEIDSFLEFKNRVIKKLEKSPWLRGKNPDFDSIFKALLGIAGASVLDDGTVAVPEAIGDDARRKFIEGVVSVSQLFQQYHELYVAIPPYMVQFIASVSDAWLKLATEFLVFNAGLSITKDVEVQDKYYIIVPLLERIMKTAQGGEPVDLARLLLLILVYKIYTTALQKNHFMDDVQDLFILFTDNLGTFDHESWKNPLLDNFHRMLVQVGLMLRKNAVVEKAIHWRRTYFDAIKDHLIHDGQDPNVILNVININFSVAKNYLQLGLTDKHESMLFDSDQWLDALMDKYPFTKKAWKMKAKMIRSLGHNALRRGNNVTCYKAYLKALVLSDHHKLPREYDRAMMYVEKYSRFFKEDHLQGLKKDLELMSDRLGRTRLLYTLSKMFTARKQWYQAMLIQKIMVDVLKEEHEALQMQLALGESTPELVARAEEVEELYANNLDFLGKMHMRSKNVDAARDCFGKEAALFEGDKPRKQAKILLKIARDMAKFSRFKDAIDYGEKAYHVAREHEDEAQPRILEFLIEACKMGNDTRKLADYKKLLYQ